MPNVNVVLLAGRLTRDPELRYMPSGGAVCDFSVAVNRKRKKGDEYVDEVCFVDSTAFGKQAEALAAHLKKGAPLMVNGHLQLDQWTTPDGQKRSKLKVVADRVEFLGVKEPLVQTDEEAVAQDLKRGASEGEDPPF